MSVSRTWQPRRRTPLPKILAFASFPMADWQKFSLSVVAQNSPLVL